MKVTASQVKAIGNEVLAVASAFDPKDALILKGLLDAATKLNDMIHAIKTQDATNKGEVWDQISDEYATSLHAYQASLAKH